MKIKHTEEHYYEIWVQGQTFEKLEAIGKPFQYLEDAEKKADQLSLDYKVVQVVQVQDTQRYELLTEYIQNKP
jgi:hypothetical protein